MYLRLLISCCYLFIFTIACKPIEDVIKDPEDKAEFSAQIDGLAFSVRGIQISAEYNTINPMVSTMTIGAVKLPLGGVTEAIALAIVSADSIGINVGDVFTANSNTKIGAGEYSLDDDNMLDVKAVSENTNIATITITALDLDKKIVSGTFSFEAADEDDLSKVYKITQGVFTDIPFD